MSAPSPRWPMPPAAPARDFVPDEVTRAYAGQTAAGTVFGSAARVGQLASARRWWLTAPAGAPCPECGHTRGSHDRRTCDWAVNGPEEPQDAPDRPCGCPGPQPRPIELGIADEYVEPDAGARVVVFGDREVIRYRRLALPAPIHRLPDCALCHEELSTDGDSFWCEHGCGSWPMGGTTTRGGAGEADVTRPQCPATWSQAGAPERRFRCVFDDGHDSRRSRQTDAVMFDHAGVRIDTDGTALDDPSDWLDVETARWLDNGRLAW